MIGADGRVPRRGQPPEHENGSLIDDPGDSDEEPQHGPHRPAWWPANAAIGILAGGPSRIAADPTAIRDPPAVSDFVQRFAERGVTATVVDVDTSGVRVEGWRLNAPRRSYELANGGRLDVFLYADVRAARVAAAQVAADADCRPIDWAVDVRYFLCGELIVFQGSQDADAWKVIQDLCGPPFAIGRRKF